MDYRNKRKKEGEAAPEESDTVKYYLVEGGSTLDDKTLLKGAFEEGGVLRQKTGGADRILWEIGDVAKADDFESSEKMYVDSVLVEQPDGKSFVLQRKKSSGSELVLESLLKNTLKSEAVEVSVSPETRELFDKWSYNIFSGIGSDPGDIQKSIDDLLSKLSPPDSQAVLFWPNMDHKDVAYFRLQMLWGLVDPFAKGFSEEESRIMVQKTISAALDDFVRSSTPELAADMTKLAGSPHEVIELVKGYRKGVIDLLDDHEVSDEVYDAFVTWAHMLLPGNPDSRGRRLTSFDDEVNTEVVQQDAFTDKALKATLLKAGLYVSQELAEGRPQEEIAAGFKNILHGIRSFVNLEEHYQHLAVMEKNPIEVVKLLAVFNQR